jgi:hypothetical protein
LGKQNQLSRISEHNFHFSQGLKTAQKYACSSIFITKT